MTFSVQIMAQHKQGKGVQQGARIHNNNNNNNNNNTHNDNHTSYVYTAYTYCRGVGPRPAGGGSQLEGSPGKRPVAVLLGV